MYISVLQYIQTKTKMTIFKQVTTLFPPDIPHLINIFDRIHYNQEISFEIDLFHLKIDITNQASFNQAIASYFIRQARIQINR